MSPDISAAKAALRAELRASRAGRRSDDPGFGEQLGDLISRAHVVAGYIAYADEPDITSVLHDVLNAGKEVLLPILRDDKDLDWGIWRGEKLIQRGKLLEPMSGHRKDIARADLVIVPALAVDQHGHRLGQGGGSYDRVLARITSTSVAVIYDDEILDSIPHEEHDQHVSMAITPSQTVRF